MSKLFRRHARVQPEPVCFCDACGTVTPCGASDRIAAARQDAQSRIVGIRMV